MSYDGATGSFWQDRAAFKFHVSHHPHKKTIRIKLWQNGVTLIDTKDFVDPNDSEALHGGKLGVYFIGMKNIKVKFSQLSYR